MRAEDLSYPFRSSTALVTVNVIRNNAQPQFTNAGVYDQTVDEDISVLEEILTVSATDSDDGINGDVFYSIVNSPAEATVFQIGSESGVISARISLIGTSEDVYRVGLFILTDDYNGYWVINQMPLYMMYLSFPS